MRVGKGLFRAGWLLVALTGFVWGQETIDITQPSGDTTNESGVYVFTVTRSSGTDFCAVEYSMFNGTASAGSDFTADDPLSGTLEFSGATLSHDVTVAISSDSVLEGDETFDMSIFSLVTSGTAACVIGESLATVTITNDDLAEINFSPLSEAETNASQFFGAVGTLDSDVQDGFTVNLNLTDGSAIVGTDYGASSEQAIYAGVAGEQFTFQIEVFGDLQVEPDEDFSFGLTGLSGNGFDPADLDLDMEVFSITNDDVAQITIGDVSVTETGATQTGEAIATLNNPVQDGFTVDLSLSAGTATEGSDYTDVSTQAAFAGSAGEEFTFSIDILGDDVVEADESFTMALTNLQGNTVDANDLTLETDAVFGIDNDDVATVTIAAVSELENDTNTTRQAIATLDNDVDGGFSIDLALSDGSALLTSDYIGSTETAVFAGTANEEYTFDITIVGDTVVEADQSFTMALNDASIAGNVVDPADLTFESGALFTIENDDVATVTIADASVTEGDAGTSGIELIATLDAGAEGGFLTTLDVTTMPGTADVGSDYVSSTEIASFAGNAGEEYTFTVTINGDMALEGDETFTAALTGPDGNSFDAADLTLETDAVGTILNDDAAAVAIAFQSATETEATQGIEVYATLDNDVQDGFTVDLSLTDGRATAGSDYTDNSSSAIFAGSLGEVFTFTIDILGDEIVERVNEEFTMALDNLTGNGFDAADLTLEDDTEFQISDNDSFTITVDDFAEVEGNEGTSDFSFTVSSDLEVDTGFTVELTTVDGSAMSASSPPVANDYVEQTNAQVVFAGSAGEQQVLVVQVNGDRFDTEGNFEEFFLDYLGASVTKFDDGDANNDFSFERMNVTLDRNAGAGPWAAVGTINDDDIDADRDGIPAIFDPDDMDKDTDDDGVEDGIEVMLGNDPTVPDMYNLDDTDGDGIPDDVEIGLGLDPNNADQDGNGEVDGYQFADKGLPLQDAFLGDANGDDVVDTADVIHILRQIRGIAPVLTRSKDLDINRDGVIDRVDVLLLSQKVRGYRKVIPTDLVP